VEVRPDFAPGDFFGSLWITGINLNLEKQTDERSLRNQEERI
jgi:hypothetical protein